MREQVLLVLWLLAVINPSLCIIDIHRYLFHISRKVNIFSHMFCLKSILVIVLFQNG